LTVGLPPALTAAVGMDALSHNLEAYCCPFYHPIAEGAGLRGVALVKEWLARAVKDGGDLMARSQMMTASLAGAVAFQKGTGGTHALSHPLSSVLGVHHGLGNAVLMPYVVAFNRPAIEAKLSALAGYLGLGSAPEAVIDWLVALRAEIGIPHTLDKIGVPQARIPEFSAMAEKDVNAPENPLPITKAAAEQLYRQACRGEVYGG
jgi:alcohol dehydrogenase class IV